MATRQATLILKHSNIAGQTFPSSIQAGEAIVNLNDGIMLFSGQTTTPTSGWTHSGQDPTFFEVGSNLYDLKIRNQITSYSGVTNLTGKFLSGTSTGFVLANTSDIAGIDTFVTGFTYGSNIFTIKQNQGQSNLSVYLDTVTGLTVNGNITVTGNTNISGNTNATDLYLNGRLKSYSGLTNISGKFLSGTTDGFVLNEISAITGIDSFVTGFTYSPTTNVISLNQNNNGSNFSIGLNVFSGITVSNLNSGQVVYAGASGVLKTESGFEYNENTNNLLVPNLEVSSDVMIHGNLTVFGSSISAFTSQLYVEDPNVIFNYNPTGSTIGTSVNAGITIQDGSGVTGQSVNFDIIRLTYLTGLTATQTPDVSEYLASTGYVNRGWITQLNDIVIRSTDITDGGVAGDVNGVRVLAEFDILDAGTY